MGATVLEAPVVEAVDIATDYADGWFEEVNAGVTIIKFFRLRGPRERPERHIIHEIGLPTFAHEASVQSSALSCVRTDCVKRVTGMKR